MAVKLYYPTLVAVLRGVCIYIQRYKPQLERALQENFGEEAVLAMGAVMVACETFTGIVEITPNP
jgi:hypothetical protein